MSLNESQGNKLATFTLTNGRDYVAWSSQFESWCYEENLWQHISGYITPIPQPDLVHGTKTDIKNYFSWRSENAKAKNMILKCLDIKYRVLVQDIDNVNECWEKLKTHFMKDSIILYQQLEDEFDSFRLDYSKSMEENILDFNNLISKLKYINIAPSEQKKCHKLMAALPKSYNPIKAIIKFAVTKTNPITLTDLTERIEDYARERSHWSEPIKKAEQINHLTETKPKTFKNKKYSNKLDQKDPKRASNTTTKINYNSNKGNNSQRSDKDKKCTLCEGPHPWLKCPYKAKILSMGKKLRSDDEQQTQHHQDTNETNYIEDDKDDNYIYHLNDKLINNDNCVIVDSGCTMIASNNKKFFKKLTKIEPVAIKQFSSQTSIKYGGSIRIPIQTNNGETFHMEFDDAVYEPNATKTLISTALLTDKYNFDIKIHKNQITLLNKDIQIDGIRKGKLYYLPISNNKEINNLEYSNDLIKWHYKLGHLSYHTIIKMSKEGKLPSNLKNLTFPKYCLTCNKGKQSRKPFPKSSSNKAKEINENIIMDLLVLNKRSIHGHKYVLGCMDQYSSYDKAYFLKRKSETTKFVKEHIRFVERYFDRPIINITSDRGGEFLNKALTKWLKKKGIKINLSTPKSSQQIGQRERAWRTNAAMMRCLLFQSNLPIFLWNYAYDHAITIRNRITSSISQKKSPLEKAFNIKPNLKDLPIFGSPCSVKLHDTKKLDYRSEEGIFLGFNRESKGYNIWDPIHKKVLVRRDVIFNEDVILKINPSTKLHHLKLKVELLNTSNVSNNINNEAVQDDVESIKSDSTISDFDFEMDDSTTDEEERSTYIKLLKTIKENSKNDYNTNINTNIINESDPISHSNTDKNDATLRRSERTTYQPLRYESIYQLSNDIYNVPKSFYQAMQSKYADEWYRASIEEIDALVQNNTWNIVEKPKNKPVLRWNFKIKTDINGNISRFKARLCARGDLQKTLYSSIDTESSVLSTTTLNILLTVGHKLGYVFKNIDINNAYLYGIITDEVYMHLPTGFFKNEKRNNMVAKLNRGLYGLKQSAKLWYDTLSNTLIKLGFQNLLYDKCLFMKNHPTPLILGIYVDDILLISPYEKPIDNFINDINKIYKIKTFNEFTDILGTRVIKHENYFYLNQDTYLKQLLNKFNYTNINTIRTPMEKSLELVLDKSINSDNNIINDFQQKVGSILYAATHTRPDIMFSTTQLAKVSSNPTNEQLKYLKRVFKYIKNTIHLSLRIDSSKEIILKGYADASYASDTRDRRSISGYIFYIDDTPISWKTSKQKLVAKSTMEAELYALEDATSECIWLRYILTQLGFNQPSTTIYQDNQATIKYVLNQHRNARNKHIDIKTCYVFQHIKNKEINLQYISTKDMIADGFTKALGPTQFTKFIENLNMWDIKKEY